MLSKKSAALKLKSRDRSSAGLVRKTNGYVAFLDILGFSDLLNDKRFHEKIELIVERLRSRADYDGKHYPSLSYIAISDSIIITAGAAEGYALIRKVGQIQNSLLKIGFAIRGAISFGETLTYNRETGKNIFGKAYLEAYRTEQSFAIYPRVVIAKSAIADIRTDIQVSTDRPLTTYVLTDTDGIKFVNQFSSDVIGLKAKKNATTRKISKKNCEIYQDTIDAGLQSSDPKVNMKWRWLQRQFDEQFPDL